MITKSVKYLLLEMRKDDSCTNTSIDFSAIGYLMTIQRNSVKLPPKMKELLRLSSILILNALRRSIAAR
jgi:hypothetical protein